MTRRIKLAIGAAVALLGAAAGIMLATGENKVERTAGAGSMVIPIDRPASPDATTRTSFTTIADPGGWCPKCDGPMSAPLTDDDIRQAGEAAQILVMGLREPRGIGLPVWHDWAPGGWNGVPPYPVPTMPTGGRAPWPSLPDRCIGCGPVLIGVPATPGPIPESSAWAMLLIGFGATGFTLRKRQQQ